MADLHPSQRRTDLVASRHSYTGAPPVSEDLRKKIHAIAERSLALGNNRESHERLILTPDEALVPPVPDPGPITLARARARGLQQLNDTNLRRLIKQSIAIADDDASSADAVGFMARILVQTTLPHRDPGAVQAWGRRNGSFSILIQPGVKMLPDGTVQSVGMPFGTYPRILLAWITTEAVRTKSPRLELGKSLKRFMEALDITLNGKNAKRLRDQMLKLFSAQISWSYDNDQVDIEAGIRPVELRQLWWDPKRPDQDNLWSSFIELNQRFYNELVTRPVPLDMRALAELARERTPLGMDLYMWLTYRMSRLDKPVMIPWEKLEEQFGAAYGRGRDFRPKFRKRLEVVLQLYPKARVFTTSAGIRLEPSSPHVAKLPR